MESKGYKAQVYVAVAILWLEAAVRSLPLLPAEETRKFRRGVCVWKNRKPFLRVAFARAIAW
jgi:hypothetical protein